ncbi:hypothetical protein RCH17_003410 [Arthrobacter sp. MP_M7]|nr:hypothetical protein [Arthrobacter sp. MP_M4]MEC5204581.1 hypothetical protein [Arthrobacter sp. MP_M7]
MTHHEIQTLTDLPASVVALEDQLGPLEKQGGLGSVRLGSKRIETAVEVFGNS